MSLDPVRGIVYAPTGSAAFDFYGGDRIGDDLFANSLLALDAETGQAYLALSRRAPRYLDRDFPSAPALLAVRRDGKEVDAVTQTSKQGFVYLSNRATGAPLFPIESRKYPASTVPGEVAATEQLLPTKPLPFARQLLTDKLLTERTSGVKKWAAERFAQLRSEGQFVPLSIGKDTVVFPGYDGGAEWGGPAIDRQTGIIYNQLE